MHRAPPWIKTRPQVLHMMRQLALAFYLRINAARTALSCTECTSSGGSGP
ncbi:MAG: hypothetical protein ACTSRH_13415 [Promethearchaeota archaeon]